MGVIWAPESPTWSVYVDFSMFFLVSLKKGRKGVESSLKRCLFGGGRHGSSVVNSSKNLVFRVFKQTPSFCTIGSIFCIMLGSCWEPSSSGWPKQAHKTQTKKQRNTNILLRFHSGAQMVDFGRHAGPCPRWGNEDCTRWASRTKGITYLLLLLLAVAI